MRRVVVSRARERVRRRLHQEAAVSERELHVGHAHDRPGVDGSADPGLARADRAGQNLRTPRPLGLLVDDRSTQAPGWNVVADQPAGDLLTKRITYSKAFLCASLPLCVVIIATGF